MARPGRVATVQARVHGRQALTDWAILTAFGLAASGATLLGGMIAFRFGEQISALLAVAAGIVIGVALFDLLPEALERGEAVYSHRSTLGFAALGLTGYLLLGRLFASAEGRARWGAHLGPASLTLHSFLDGLGIGLAFQISPQVGFVVALAVLTHDVADGLNTVSLALAIGERRLARRWLIANGAAPLLGVLLGALIEMPDVALTPVMAVFAGAFLYIGAVELVPRSLARDGRLRTTAYVVGGVALIAAVTAIAHSG